MINGERTGARPEKAFGLLLCLDYDLMLKSWHGNQMLGNKTSWPRNRSRRGPSKSAAQLFRGQICALHTLLVNASVAARITSEGSVINKLGRSAMRTANFSKTLEMDPGASFRRLSLHPLIATRCQETVLLHTTTRH